MSIPNEIYLNYPGFMEKQDQAKKDLRNKISNFQKAAQSGTNTIGIEDEIERDIKNLKEKHHQLDDAYSNRNAPSHIPSLELDKRQKDIQQLLIDIKEIEKAFKNVQSQKYSFKGKMEEGDYQPTAEMKTMSNSELLMFQKDKIKDQDKQIDDITLDVKKGRVLAKEAQHTMEEQNKQLDQLQEDIDKLDSRFQKGIKRFENYVAKQSGCCISLVLIAELAAAFLIYFLLITD